MNPADVDFEDARALVRLLDGAAGRETREALTARVVAQAREAGRQAGFDLAESVMPPRCYLPPGEEEWSRFAAAALAAAAALTVAPAPEKVARLAGLIADALVRERLSRFSVSFAEKDPEK